MVYMALKWVELLLEPGISEEKLVESSQHLCQAQYSDVVEERSIERLCGYPLCSQPLDHVTTQQYHVSVKHKQVYDLTLRKKFCSNACYRKSCYFSSQLYTLPLRARVGSRPLDVKLLSDEGTPAKVQATPPVCNDSSEEIHHVRMQGSPMEVHIKPSEKRIPGVDERTQATPLEIRSKEKTTDVKTQDAPADSKNKPGKNSSTKMKTKPARVMEAVVYERQQVLAPEPLSEYVEAAPPPPLSSVGKLLHAMSLWSSPTACPSRRGKEVGSAGGELPSTTESVSLPAVDATTQQRKIFQQGLQNQLPYVASQLGLATHQVSSQLASITATFKLDRHTVTFRVAEWRVIIAVLLIVIHPELRQSNHTTIAQWLRSISATESDLELMLKTLL